MRASVVLLAATILACTDVCQPKDLPPGVTGDIYKMCKNTVDAKDPQCLHGGVLNAKNTSETLHCATCSCPEGWTGADCALCARPDVCPAKQGDAGQELRPIGCSSESMMPNGYEFATAGKRFSCACGGVKGDASTEWACSMQPLTYWQFDIRPRRALGGAAGAPAPQPALPGRRGLGTAGLAGAAREGLDVYIIERAGMPSQDVDADSPCPPEKKAAGKCQFRDRWKYAYASVWEGNLTDCTFSTGECTRPLEGDDCLVASCTGGSFLCPPKFVKKCPGWTPTDCAVVPHEPLTYYMHRCNPLALPKNDTPTTLSCKPEAVNGTFQCYFGQEGGFLASLGMQCKTGTCIYNSTSPDPGPVPPPPGPPLPPAPGRESHDLAAELVTLTLLGLAVGGIIAAAAVAMFADSRRSQKRIDAWLHGKALSDAGLEEPLIAEEHALFEASSVEQPQTLEWDNISCRVYKANGQSLQVLRGISGITSTAAGSGSNGSAPSMTAILGPSGAGKTTLLDILAGRRAGQGVGGRVLLNGRVAQAATLRHTVGYMQQDIVLPGTSTVWEYMRFHARLRMPGASGRQMEQRLWDVLQQLGLGKVAHSLIGDAFMRGLSGGEQRRVSIAAELLTRPGCALLDEPTTGLDSSNAAAVVDILAALARGGTTVVLSIHQPRPDVLRLMSRMVLLSSNGQVVYSGPMAAAAAYFERQGMMPGGLRSNIADHMLDLVIKAPPPEVSAMVQRFTRSDIAAEDRRLGAELRKAPAPLPPPKQRGPFALQLRVLSTRIMRKLYRHPFLILVNFIATLVTAIGIGLVFRNVGVDTPGIQNRLGVLFFMLLFLSMMSLSALPIWREEKLLFIRERDAGAYGTRAYYLAVLLFDVVPMRVLPPIFFAIFSYWMIGLHTRCVLCIFNFIGVLVSTNIAAAAMSQAIGAAAPSLRSANLLGSFAVMAFLLFGGFLLNKDQVPWYCGWIAGLSFFNYAYEALAINEFHNAPVDFLFTSPINHTVLPTLRVSGDGVLREFGFSPQRFVYDACAVWLLAAGFALLTYWFLSEAGRDSVPPMLLLRRWLGKDREEPAGHADGSAGDGNLSRRKPQPAATQPDVPAHDDSGEATALVREASPMLPPSFGSAAQAADDSSDAGILSWEGIGCSIRIARGRQERRILDGISGVAGLKNASGAFKPCLFAVLGPSGAGKTTLIDILAGRKRDAGVTGRVSIGGLPVSAAQRAGMLGYALQDDVLPGSSTVLEYLRCHASLRLPDSMPAAAKEERVWDLIEQLRLQKVAHSLIGDAFMRGLSGGEQRRVSIAAELLTRPGCVLLDEPTTGLDSSSAAGVVDILAGLTQAGTTVVLTIHQPREDIFSLMQRVLILSSEGRMVFSGPKDAAAPHFALGGQAPPSGGVSIADHMLEVVIRAPPAEVAQLVEQYRASEVAAQDAAHMEDLASSGRGGQLPPQRYRASYWRQVTVLAQRVGRTMWRSPMLLTVNWSTAALMSVGIGIVYFHVTRDTGGIQNRFGSLFFILLYLAVMSLSSLPLWMEDRLLFIRERAAGLYGTPAYFTTMALADLVPMRLVPPFFFGLATYWMVGLRPGLPAAASFWLTLALSNMVGAAMNMAVGAAAPSSALANLFGSLAVLLSILFGGFLLSRSQMPAGVAWMAHLSFIRYSFEALAYTEFHGQQDFFFTPYAQRRIPGAQLPSVHVDGDTVLRTFGFDTQGFWSNLGVLCLLLAAYLAATLVLLVVRRH